jgi:hypothetical protein
LRDALQHAIAILRHIVVPEPQHAPTLGSQKSIASGVGRAFRMLAAVDLYDQSMRDRSEIRDERTDRDLTAEFDTRESTIS